LRKFHAGFFSADKADVLPTIREANRVGLSQEIAPRGKFPARLFIARAIARLQQRGGDRRIFDGHHARAKHIGVAARLKLVDLVQDRIVMLIARKHALRDDALYAPNNAFVRKGCLFFDLR